MTDLDRLYKQIGRGDLAERLDAAERWGIARRSIMVDEAAWIRREDARLLRRAKRFLAAWEMRGTP